MRIDVCGIGNRLTEIQLWRFWHTMSGRSHRAIQKQHEIHGEFLPWTLVVPATSYSVINVRLKGYVFRVSPNELSFSSVDSWEQIYGLRAPGQAHAIKSNFYDAYGSGFNTSCIGSERDPTKHAQMKKNLVGAFSTQALNSQVVLVQKCWNEFIDKIGLASRDHPNGIDIVKWFEMAAFDTLGELAFGESFHCLENGE